MAESDSKLPEVAPSDGGDAILDLEVLSQPQRYGELGRDLVALHGSLGIDSIKSNALARVSANEVALCAGNAVVLTNLETQTSRYITGIDVGGIGGFAVDPSGRYLAVGGRGGMPRIVVYRLSDLNAMQVLEQGTEVQFSHLAFSGDGSLLASVGNAPDFTLAVWQWAEGQLLLRSKAFSQEVFTVQFNPFMAGRLTSSGIGHVRFWRMASTFTGMKLQGAIGKFGRVDLSDITAFAELPDGKVLSGSETGELMLWEGNFIKCLIARPHASSEELDARLPAHDGPIHVVKFEAGPDGGAQGGHFITGGDDGVLRWWAFEDVDVADTEDDDTHVLLDCTQAVPVATGVQVHIRGLVHREDTKYVVLDGRGGVWTVDVASGDNEKVLASHSGVVTSVVTAPSAQLCVTTGADGQVRAWDVPTRKLLCSYSTPSRIPATCSTWAPAGIGGVLVGFADGVARLLVLDQANGCWLRRQVIKPHSQQITHMAFSPDGTFLATSSVDGTVFLLSIPSAAAGGAAGGSLVPLGFVRFPYPVGSIAWAPVAKGSPHMHLLVLPHASAITHGAEMAVLPLPSDTAAYPDTNRTFELDMPYARYAVALPNKPAPLKLSQPKPLLPEAEGKAPSQEEEEALDEALLAREAGRLTAASFAPWDSAVTQASAVSFTNSKRGFDNEWRVLVSCTGALRQLLLEVALPQPSAGVLAAGNTVTLLPASEHCRESATAELCHVQPVASYAGSHAPATQIQTLQVKPKTGAAQQLLLTYGLDGAVTLRSTAHPQHYARVDCGSAQALSDYTHQAAAATFDGAYICVPTPLGAVMSVRSNVPALCAAAAKAAAAAAAAADSTLTRHGFVPHPHPHDEPEVLLPKGGAEGILAALREQREGEGAGPMALPTAVVQPGAGERGGQLMANVAVYVASRGEHAVAVEVVSNPPTLPLTEEEQAALQEAAAAAGLPAPVLSDKTQGPVLDPAALIGAPPPGAGRLHALASDSKADDAFPPAAEGKDDDSASVASALQDNEPEDITQPDAYSIQQSKLQSEEDQRRNAAEHKKEGVRGAIRDMQLQFAALRQRMGLHVTRAGLGIPEGQQGDAQWLVVQAAAQSEELPPLSDAELVIDPEMQTRLSAEAAGMTQEVERQLAYEGEQGRLAVAKLRKAFLDPLAVEDFQVRGLNDPGIMVRSLATRHLDKSLLADVEHLRDLLQDGAAAAAAESGTSGPKLSEAAAFRRRLDAADAPLTISMGADASISGSSFDVRKARRLARNAALQRIQDARPGADDANPELTLALEDAAVNRGDFPLKSDLEYEVPEHKRLDDHKKAQQITLLRAALFTVRMLFNHRLLSLRQLKAQLVAAVHASNARVLELSKGLGDEGGVMSSLWAPPSDPYADPVEWPELRELRVAHEVRMSATLPASRPHDPSTDAAPSHVAGAMLPRRAVHASSRVRVRGARAPAWAVDNPVMASAMVGSRVALGMPALPSTVAGASQPATHLRAPPVPVMGACVPVAINQSEARSEALRRKWTAARRRIIRNISAAVKGFDDALSQLAKERLTVASDLKAGEVRYLVLAHELTLLQDMAKRDRALSSKLSKSLGEKASIGAALAECGAAIDEKLAQQAAWESRDAGIMAQFDEMVPDTHPAHAELLRVFRRKVKRHKAEDGEGDEDSDEESELNFDSDDDDEDEGGDDVCPEGCEQSLFDRVLDLREERLDLEEVQVELADSRATIDKAFARHKARQTQVASELAGIRKEMQAFQSEKQVVLNKLTITVPLHFSQIYLGKGGVVDVQDDADGNAHPNPKGSGVPAEKGATIADVLQLHQEAEGGDRRPAGQLPATLSGALLFNKDKLQGLRMRVGTLKSDITSLRDGFKELHRGKRRLGREQGEVEAGIAAAKKKAEDLQVLKFGQMVDISTLDKATGSATLNKAEAEVGSQEQGQRSEAARVQESIKGQQAALVEVTRGNTRLLEHIADLTGKQNTLEVELDDTSSATALLAPDSAASQEAAAEKVRLQQLVQLQNAEMEALRGEVFVLRHKGGYLYAPGASAPAPRPPNGREGLAQGSAAAAIHAARNAASGVLPLDDTDTQFLGAVEGSASATQEGKK